MMYRNFGKRLLDILFSLLGLALAAPFILLCAILLAFQNKGQILFKQTRPGKNERPFVIYKLKTMNDRKDTNGNLLDDKYRLTKVGRVIRKLSLDEIPQLLNVLKGDMSLIGPRPLLVEYLPLYNDEQKQRHNVRPGITGLAQVNGRNLLSWKEKFQLDVEYVQNVSLKLDLIILFLTLKKVLKSEGISSGTSVTMEKFTGSN